MNAASLKKKINRILTKFQASDRRVYKRVVHRTGGDPLLGRGATVSYTDTLLVPTPVVTQLQVGIIDTLATFGKAQVGDYHMVISVSSLSQSDLNNADLLLVLRDADNHDEELAIVEYLSPAVQNQQVIHELIARSRKR